MNRDSVPVDNGTYIRWSLKICCARMKENSFFLKKETLCRYFLSLYLSIASYREILTEKRATGKRGLNIDRYSYIFQFNTSK